MKIKWNNNSKDKAREAIVRLLNIKRQSGKKEGWPLHPIITMGLTEISYSIINIELNDGEIQHILGLMYKKHWSSLEKFEKCANDYLRTRNIRNKKSNTKWRILLPISIEISDDVSLPIRMYTLGYNYYLIAKKSAEKHVGKNILKNHIERGSYWNINIPHPKYYLSTIVEGVNTNLAWDIAIPSFDTLRGLLEYSYSSGRWNRPFGARILKRHSVPHPLWVIIDSKDTSQLFHFETEAENKRKDVVLNRKVLDKYYSYAEHFKRRTSRGSTLEILSDALRLYSQALDQREDHLCFLGFWQMAETLVLSRNFGGDTKEVCRRIAWHGSRLKMMGTGIRNTLLAFARKRNDIVHKGIHSVTDEDVNIIKTICEISFEWMISNYSNIPSNAHLDEFYRITKYNKDEIKRIMNLMNYAIDVV